VSASFSPADVAKRYGVSPLKVRKWIEHGELRAINVVGRLGGRKPRWRVPVEALAEFEKRRSSKVAVTDVPARFRRTEAAITQFF
jgi:excisionase family DNA binding protein